MKPVHARILQFIRERKLLHNVSPLTLLWYEHSLKWMPNEDPTDTELKEIVCAMREKGLKASGCNAATRACNAYLKWSGSPHRIPRMKEPVFVAEVFTEAQIKTILNFNPRTFYDRRLHLLCLILLDSGARISEVTGLKVSDIDMDNLLVKLMGKGRKERVIPISLELRKVLYKYIRDYRQAHDFLLANQKGRKFNRNAALRDVKKLCTKLGFRAPSRTLHAFRHTFSCNYIRRGGDVLRLQKMLGHTTLEMTRRYRRWSARLLASSRV
jgi:integrase/recombinase XerD